MLGFVFPGQGSQRPGMGTAWADHPSWEVVTEASAITGRDLATLLLNADEEELRQTKNAQLVTFTMSLVVLDAIERLGITPNFAAGHSLGEYTALVATGAVAFDEGAQLVMARGDAMQSAAEDQPGSMAAVLGLDDDDVDIVCRRADADVWVANFNAPGQVVIAGSEEGIEKAAELAKEYGAKRTLRFPVGGAFHTPYMASAQAALRKAIDQTTFRDADVPVYNNVDTRPRTEGSEFAKLLSAQLTSPVRWRQSIDRMIEDGATTLVEVGAGGVLTGLTKRISSDLNTVSVATPNDLDVLVETVTKAPPIIQWRQEHQGEHLYMSERLIVSPATGLFQPLEEEPKTGEKLSVGTLLGNVGDAEVRSPFAGELMGILAIEGERITTGQPIAWLRAQ